MWGSDSAHLQREIDLSSTSICLKGNRSVQRKRENSCKHARWLIQIKFISWSQNSAGPPGEAAAACPDRGPAFRDGNGTTAGNRTHSDTGLSPARCRDKTVFFVPLQQKYRYTCSHFYTKNNVVLFFFKWTLLGFIDTTILHSDCLGGCWLTWLFVLKLNNLW